MSVWVILFYSIIVAHVDQEWSGWESYLSHTGSEAAPESIFNQVYEAHYLFLFTPQSLFDTCTYPKYILYAGTTSWA